MLHVLRLALLVILLATLDVAGAVALKEARQRHDPNLALLGAGLFIVIAVLLYVTLDYAELTLVSLAWIVLYQVAAVGVDAVMYEVIPSRLQLVALVVALLALVVAGIAGPAQAEVQGRHRVPQQRTSYGSRTSEDRTHKLIGVVSSGSRNQIST